MGEFQLIEKYFNRNVSVHNCSNIELGIGDDCALLNVAPDCSLAVSTDTFLEGTHFFKGTSPYAIGYKSLAVNISDLAAMGADPLGFTLALTLPDDNESFVAEFADGLFDIADRFKIPLIGGDTTKGPLSVTITVFGNVRKGHAIKRASARIGDAVCVSGLLGGAAYGVALRYGKESSDSHDAKEKAFKLLDYPNPRMDLVPFFHRYNVHSALDISDGFIGDLGHILDCSGVSCKIELCDFPVSDVLMHLSRQKQLDYALNGGDDYELCFTLAEDDYNEWIEASEKGLAPIIYRVGSINSNSSSETDRLKTGGIIFTEHGNRINHQTLRHSFSHF